MQPASFWRQVAIDVLTSVLLLIIAFLDHISGPEPSFFAFYFAPILLAGWHRGVHQAVDIALTSAILWFLVDIDTHLTYSHFAIPFWNTAIKLSAFLTVAYLTAKVRSLLQIERALTASLRSSLATVKQLSGLLPICSGCKKIRNDDGYWQQIETYIRNHSDADFSHSLCPDCLRHLYPELADSVLERIQVRSGPASECAAHVQPEKPPSAG